MRPRGKDRGVDVTPPPAGSSDGESREPECGCLLSRRRYCNLDAILANTWWLICKVKCTTLRIIQAGPSFLLLPVGSRHAHPGSWSPQHSKGLFPHLVVLKVIKSSAGLHRYG